MSMKKLFGLSALMASGAMVFEGCVGAFFDGLLNEGGIGPQWLDLALDIVREDLFS